MALSSAESGVVSYLSKYVRSAARMQEELGWTRSSLRKCIRPPVENGLRAHDDDSRAPVLNNRPGPDSGNRAGAVPLWCGSFFLLFLTSLPVPFRHFALVSA